MKKDTIAKKYMSEPAHFADFFNGYIYKGEEVIRPEDLREVDTTNIAMIPVARDGKNDKTTRHITVKRYRDVLKKTVIMKTDNLYYMFLGIENQTDIHYAMPARNMLYDSLIYSKQIESIAKYNRANGRCEDSGEFLSGLKKDDKLIPIVTVTVYWGTEPWDAPVKLKDMFQDGIDAETMDMINDYDCNLFSIIDAEELPEYKTELKELFEILRIRNDGEKLEKLMKNNASYQNIDRDTAVLMSEFANIKLPKRSKEGDYNMCKAIIDLENKNKKIGIDIGVDKARVEAIKNLMETTEKDFEEVCYMLKLSEEDMLRYKDAV